MPSMPRCSTKYQLSVERRAFKTLEIKAMILAQILAQMEQSLFIMIANYPDLDGGA